MITAERQITNNLRFVPYHGMYIQYTWDSVGTLETPPAVAKIYILLQISDS